jgi:hypothetical protein
MEKEKGGEDMGIESMEAKTLGVKPFILEVLDGDQQFELFDK